MTFPLRLQAPCLGPGSPAQLALMAGREVIVQYSAAPDTGTMEKIDALARKYPSQLIFRVYGFYTGAPFDAALLDLAPSLRRLHIDCLMTARNLGTLAHRQGLTELGLDVYDLKETDLLNRIDGSTLEHIRLADLKTGAFDLAPLAGFHALKYAFFGRNAKNIEALARHPTLESLRLSPHPKRDYAFLASLPRLQSFFAILGGTANFNSFAHDNLREFEIIRVRGFDDTGDLSRFPRLETLTVEDQIRLTRIALPGSLTHLRAIRLVNCKTLAALDGIAALPALRSLRVFRTALDLDALEAMPLPEGFEDLALFSGRRREDDPRQQRQQSRGFG